MTTSTFDRLRFNRYKNFSPNTESIVLTKESSSGTIDYNYTYDTESSVVERECSIHSVDGSRGTPNASANFNDYGYLVNNGYTVTGVLTSEKFPSLHCVITFYNADSITYKFCMDNYGEVN